MKTEIIELTLPDWTASPLINGDYSGLSERDEDSLIRLIQRYRCEYGQFYCVDVKDDSGFHHWNDLNNLGDQCSTFIFHATPFCEADPSEGGPPDPSSLGAEHDDL